MGKFHTYDHVRYEARYDPKSDQWAIWDTLTHTFVPWTEGPQSTVLIKTSTYNKKYNERNNR